MQPALILTPQKYWRGFMLRIWYCLIFFSLCSVVAAYAEHGFGELCGETIRVGLRSDAPPFSYRPDSLASVDAEQCGFPKEGAFLKNYAGYTVELCRSFVDAIQSECSDDPAVIRPVHVPLSRRRAMLAERDPNFDLLCGATTATVTLRAEVPTSPYTFLTGTSVLAGPALQADSNCRVGVVGNTTSDASTMNTDAMEQRLPGWENFAKQWSACNQDTLKHGKVHSYENTAAAIADLLSERPKADLLLEDRHILQWHLENITLLRGAVSLGPNEPPKPLSQLQPDEIRQIQRRLTLLPDIITIEPYAVIGTSRSRKLLAHFSRHLTRFQGTSKYRDLLQSCFRRQVDRSFWFLIEFQSNVREGDFLVPSAGTDNSASDNIDEKND